uniref:NADH-ubiquinone oxidoreductase chain 6 n=1 Tax=Byrrhinus sp. BYR01 TaxID=1205541 RepID=A0A0S2MRP8_9COLE|nr:NADH deshydrogenase subunit 6 [Byrrhinus sp. BYR01]
MYKHPMSMGLTLLIQTLITALCTGFFSLNFWFSYIIFLIMIGGMLVLFIYMTSIAANEKFIYSNKTMIIMMMILFMSIIMFIMNDEITQMNNLPILEMMNMNSNAKFSLYLSKFVNYPSNVILITLMIYLFITLIAVVKITNIKYGPLRQTE